MPPRTLPPSLPSRSRTGCRPCRQRHRKCDEQRPTCGPCLSRHLHCEYRLNLRWANNESTTSFAGAPVRPSTTSRATRRAARGQDGADAVRPAPDTARDAYGRHDDALQLASVRTRDTHDDVDVPPGIVSPPITITAASDVVASPPPRFMGEAIYPALDSLAVAASAAAHLPFFDVARSYHPVAEPDHDNDNDNDFAVAAADEPSEDTASEATSPRLHRDDEFLSTSPSHRDPHQSPASVDVISSNQETTSPSSLDEWMVNTAFGGLQYQFFQSADEQMAFSYFINHVAVGMVAYDSGHNVFQTLAFLSLSYPILSHSILSVATGHMYNAGRSCADVLSERQSRALASLQAALDLLAYSEQPTPPTSSYREGCWGIFSTLSTREVALATIMMQLSVTLATGLGNAEVHLKCAQHFLMDLDYMRRPPESMFGRLFVHRFALADVVLALLRFRAPTAPDYFYMYRHDAFADDRHPSFYETHACPKRVLCFLAEIAALGAGLTEGSHPLHEAQAHAIDLEMQMREWGRDGGPPFSPHERNGGDDENESIDRRRGGSSSSRLPPPPPPPHPTPARGLAEKKAQLETVGQCFFLAAQLLLMRRVFLDPTEGVRVQFIRGRIFELMRTLPVGCGPDTFITFPFYMAAREAVTPEDRGWVRKYHADLSRVYHEQARAYMMESTEKIWERVNSATTAADQGAYGSSEPWNSPREKFIRDLDSTSTYFMY